MTTSVLAYAGRRAAIVLLMPLLLAGCGVQDEGFSRFVTSPGKFAYYDCKQIAEYMRGTYARQKELGDLMQKAGDDSAGRMVSDFAYRPEYATAEGDLRELREASIAKNCGGETAPVTGRARASDGAIQ